MPSLRVFCHIHGYIKVGMVLVFPMSSSPVEYYLLREVSTEVLVVVRYTSVDIAVRYINLGIMVPCLVVVLCYIKMI